MWKMIALAAGVLAATTGLAHDEEALHQSPPGEPYVPVSEALPLPEFIPGLGVLFVDPGTLPAGPFLAYDREGKLSATVYMTPFAALEDGVTYEELGVGLHEVVGVDIHYNAGHAGVAEPHAHVVLYHDDGARGRLAE
ncbi:hypothetical protein [Arhodomonas sp. SL1]|uniref:hypothetical protein n=1 Tax=Arhodomonas sp. SL1 TaxID=3425691 RepID=UPI003F882848